jgi:hypothetical protein
MYSYKRPSNRITYQCFRKFSVIWVVGSLKCEKMEKITFYPTTGLCTHFKSWIFSEHQGISPFLLIIIWTGETAANLEFFLTKSWCNWCFISFFSATGFSGGGGGGGKGCI